MWNLPTQPMRSLVQILPRSICCIACNSSWQITSSKPQAVLTSLWPLSRVLSPGSKVWLASGCLVTPFSRIQLISIILVAHSTLTMWFLELAEPTARRSDSSGPWILRRPASRWGLLWMNGRFTTMPLEAMQSESLTLSMKTLLSSRLKVIPLAYFRILRCPYCLRINFLGLRYAKREPETR